MIYQLHKNSFGEVNCILVVGTNMYIPFDPANTDYQAFTRWLNDGNIPLPADEGENNGAVIK